MTCGYGKAHISTSRKCTKKGVPLYSNLVNLKSNTMKNTLQSYEIINIVQIYCIFFNDL